jgi:hypothetical protein
MIGLDVYTDPSSSMSGEWYDTLEHYNGRKLIALSETGTLPSPELMDEWGIDWSYFAPWNGTFVDAFSPAQLQATLAHEDVITLDELPTMPWSASAPSTGDFDGDGDVDGPDLLAWQQQLGQTGAPGADGNGDGVVDAGDLALWRAQYGRRAAAATAAVPEPGSAALALLASSVLLGGRGSRRAAPGYTVRGSTGASPSRLSPA